MIRPSEGGAGYFRCLIRMSLNSTHMGLPGMQLESQDALRQGQFGSVGEVQHKTPVEVVPHLVPLGHDHHLVPLVEPEQLRELGGSDQVLQHLLPAVGAPDGLLPPPDTCAPACRPRRRGSRRHWAASAGCGSRAGTPPHPPAVRGVGLGVETLRAVLDARVVGRIAAKGEAQLEVLRRAAGPDQETCFPWRGSRSSSRRGSRRPSPTRAGDRHPSRQDPCR